MTCQAMTGVYVTQSRSRGPASRRLFLPAELGAKVPPSGIVRQFPPFLPSGGACVRPGSTGGRGTAPFVETAAAPAVGEVRAGQAAAGWFLPRLRASGAWFAWCLPGPPPAVMPSPTDLGQGSRYIPDRATKGSGTAGQGGRYLMPGQMSSLAFDPVALMVSDVVAVDPDRAGLLHSYAKIVT